MPETQRPWAGAAPAEAVYRFAPNQKAEHVLSHLADAPHPRFWASTKSEIAREALDRIGRIYDIEHDINGQPAYICYAARHKLTQPKPSTMACAVKTPSACS